MTSPERKFSSFPVCQCRVLSRSHYTARPTVLFYVKMKNGPSLTLCKASFIWVLAWLKCIRENPRSVTVASRKRNPRLPQGVVWPGARPDLNSLLLSPRLFCLLYKSESVPACLVNPADHVSLTKGFYFVFTDELEGMAWGRDEGCFSEIFNRVLEGMRLYWPQLTQTTNSVTKPYLCAALTLDGWSLFHRAAFALFTIFSKWES